MMDNDLNISGAQAHIVDSKKLATFLQLIYTQNRGEIWLYNNDLNVFLEQNSFRELYVKLIAQDLCKNIDCVKFILTARAWELVQSQHQDFKDRILALANLHDGKKRLKTFFFAPIESLAIEEDASQLNGYNNNTWVFYTQNGQILGNTGFAMVRHHFPPFEDKNDSNKYAVVWRIDGEENIQRRLNSKFKSLFTSADFSYIEVFGRGKNMGYRLETKESTIYKKILEERLRQKSNNNALSLGSSVELAIIAALDIEMEALKQVLRMNNCEVRDAPIREHGYEYFSIYSSTQSKQINILLVTIRAQGNVAACHATSKVIERWKPKDLLLFGVAGGAKSGQQLGNLLICNEVIAYELAMIKNGIYYRELQVYPKNEFLYSLAIKVKNAWAEKNKTILNRPDCKDLPCVIHDESVVGSGEKLVADDNFKEEIQSIRRKVNCFEMEAGGIAFAADKDKKKILMVKSIMDLANPETRDDGKKDEWKKYASRVSAEFVYDLINLI